MDKLADSIPDRPVSAPAAEYDIRPIGAGLRRHATPWLLLAPNLAWLAFFCLGALVALFVVSLHGYEAGGRGILENWEVTNYTTFLGDPFFRDVLWRSLGMAAEVTVFCLVLGFPLALALSRLRGLPRALLYLAILMPLLTSAVVRTFGWMILLSNNGFINKSLIAAGVVHRPIRLMYQMVGIEIALIEVLLPFMVLALDAALLNIDQSLYEAARNLGARAPRIFCRITVPLSLPGIVSGSVLVFTLAISAFVTPSLIGGPRIKVMATLIYQQSMALLNWPFGAAIAFVMLFALVLAFVVVFSLSGKARAWGSGR